MRRGILRWGLPKVVSATQLPQLPTSPGLALPFFSSSSFSSSSVFARLAFLKLATFLRPPSPSSSESENSSSHAILLSEERTVGEGGQSGHWCWGKGRRFKSTYKHMRQAPQPGLLSGLGRAELSQATQTFPGQQVPKPATRRTQ